MSRGEIFDRSVLNQMAKETLSSWSMMISGVRADAACIVISPFLATTVHSLSFLHNFLRDLSLSSLKVSLPSGKLSQSGDSGSGDICTCDLVKMYSTPISC